MPLGRSIEMTGRRDRFDRVNCLRPHALDRPVEPGTEQRIDDKVGFVDDAGRQTPW